MKFPKHIELLKQASGHYEVKGTNLLVPAFELFDFMNDMLNDDHTITVYPVQLERSYSRYRLLLRDQPPKARNANGRATASATRRKPKKDLSKKRQRAV